MRCVPTYSSFLWEKLAPTFFLSLSTGISLPDTASRSVGQLSNAWLLDFLVHDVISEKAYCRR